MLNSSKARQANYFSIKLINSMNVETIIRMVAKELLIPTSNMWTLMINKTLQNFPFFLLLH